MITIRIWHKDLISVLPKKQLLGQWRECCLIAKGLSEGNLNHLLVNRVKEYPVEDLIAYGFYIFEELDKRGYNIQQKRFICYFDDNDIHKANFVTYNELFLYWHNHRYLMQCYFNLQEKFDCGGISEKEWFEIETFMVKNGLF